MPDSQLVQPALPEITWRYLDACITYAIIVPIGLFAESLFGRGWRSTLRRTWQAAAAYALLAMAHDLARRQYAAAEATLHLGDRLVFFSDGLVEACNASDEIVAELRRWVGPDTPLQDAVTLVVVDAGERMTEGDGARTGD